MLCLEPLLLLLLLPLPLPLLLLLPSPFQRDTLSGTKKNISVIKKKRKNIPAARDVSRLELLLVLVLVVLLPLLLVLLPPSPFRRVGWLGARLRCWWCWCVVVVVEMVEVIVIARQKISKA